MHLKIYKYNKKIKKKQIVYQFKWTINVAFAPKLRFENVSLIKKKFMLL